VRFCVLGGHLRHFEQCNPGAAVRFRDSMVDAVAALLGLQLAIRECLAVEDATLMGRRG
jgi:hypothetical protein